MVNMNSENNIARQPLDLNRLYGINELMETPQSNVEDLIGYNLNSSTWNEPINNNVQNSASSANMQQTLTSSNNGTNNDGSSSMVPAAPQRQEQTFPSNRESLENMQPDVISAPQNNMQPEKDMKEFLQKQIGQMVKIQFLVGTNTLVAQEGTLVGLGDNYIILRDSNTGELLICNFDDIKFIKLKNR